MRVLHLSGKTLLSLAGVALLSLSCGAVKEPPKAEPCGTLEIRSTLDDTLVYVDGRLFGMVSRKDPLIAQVSPGDHFVRASRRGQADLFGHIEVGVGKHVVLQAGALEAAAPSRLPSSPFPVGLGQTLRLMVEKDGGDTPPNLAPVFRVKAKAKDRVLLIHTEGVVPTLRVKSTQDEAIPLRLLPSEERDGLDGRTHFEFQLPEDGTADITVSGDTRQKLAQTVLWICRAPSPLIKDSVKKGRRAPPPEWPK